jgi:prevent-host-death family protein
VFEVSVRELRNHGGDVIDRVVRGEHLTVTRDGKPVAQLVPLGKPSLSVDTLLRRWRNLPPVDPQRFRRDIDAFIDPGL